MNGEQNGRHASPGDRNKDCEFTLRFSTSAWTRVDLAFPFGMVRANTGKELR